MTWNGEKQRHKLARKGIVTAQNYSLETQKHFINKANQHFILDTHDIPLFANMMENPDYFEKKKGKRFDIVYMTPKEYEQAILLGFEHNSKGILNSIPFDKLGIRYRISEENLNDLVKIMEQKKVAIPYLEYDVSYWKDKQYTHFGQEGHHRIVAAEKLGLDLIPVMIVYPTDFEEYAKINYLIPYPISNKIRGPNRKR